MVTFSIFLTFNRCFEGVQIIPDYSKTINKDFNFEKWSTIQYLNFMALQQVSAELAQGQQVRNRCILLLVVNFTMFPFNDVEVLNKMGYICYVCLKDRRPALYIYALKA